MLKQRTPFEELSATDYDEEYRARELKYLQCKAAKYGLELMPKATSEPVPS